jgi:hypothetical protein
MNALVATKMLGKIGGFVLENEPTGEGFWGGFQ